MNEPKLTMVELFSGTGMQRRGVENTKLFDLDIIATSDIEKDAIVAYAACHCNLTDEMVENYSDYPSREQMIEDLKSRNIGMDFEKDKMYAWEKLLKKKTKELEKHWLAMKLQNNLGDISKIQQLPLADFWFYSFCCQDISLSGKQKGLVSECKDCGHEFNPMLLPIEKRDKCPYCGSTNIKGSRSGLLKEVERLLVKAIETNTAPKYLCLENVKNLVSKKFKPDFDAWVARLEELGYTSYYEVLNAKECGRCQNRERVFCLSVRKDIDTGKFTFPKPFDTGVRLKDILEKNVDEKYYINTERAMNLIHQLVDKGQLKGQRACCDSTINDPNVKDISNAIIARYDAGIMNHKSVGLAVAEPQPILVKNQATEYTRTIDIANTLMARDWKGFGNQDMVAIVEAEKIDTSKRLGGMFDGETRHQAGSVWDINGMSPTIDTCQGGYREPCVVEENTSKTICVGNTTPSGKSQCNAVYSTEGVSQTLCAGTHGYATGSILEETTVETKQNNNELNNEPTVIGIKQATKKGYIECELSGCADLSYPNSKLRRGRVQGNGQIVPTLTAAESGVRYIESIYRIRKLTPKECWLLMGMTFEDCQKCMDIGLSNTALYRIAGNGIVTDCIKLIFEHLYKAQYDKTYICTDEKYQSNFQETEVEK